MRRLLPPLLTVLLHAAAILPLLWLGLDFATGRLTANPVREIQLRTGSYAILLLTLELACTPAYTMTGLERILRLRRALGLYAFAYAALHVLNLLLLDYALDLRLLWRDVAGKYYVLAGFPAFIILLALAATSTRGWVRRLGKRWRRLHRLAYAAGVLAVVHYLWQVKVPVPAPFIYGGAVAILLLIRIPAIERYAARMFRRGPAGAGRA